MKKLLISLALGLSVTFLPMTTLAEQQYKLLWEYEATTEGTAVGFTVFQNNISILDIPESGIRELGPMTLNLTGYDEFIMIAYYSNGGHSNWWGGPCGGPFLIVDGEPQGDLTWPPLDEPNCPYVEPIVEEPVDPVEPIVEEPVDDSTGKKQAPGQLKKQPTTEEPVVDTHPGRGKGRLK